MGLQGSSREACRRLRIALTPLSVRDIALGVGEMADEGDRAKPNKDMQEGYRCVSAGILRTFRQPAPQTDDTIASQVILLVFRSKHLLTIVVKSHQLLVDPNAAPVPSAGMRTFKIPENIDAHVIADTTELERFLCRLQRC
jgi:hypothetical protein